MIYFIQGKSSLLIKIAVTEDEKTLLNSLIFVQSTNSEALELLGVGNSPEIGQNGYLANFLKEKFKSSNHHGLWFTPNAEILEFVQSQSNVRAVMDYDQLKARFENGTLGKARHYKQAGRGLLKLKKRPADPSRFRDFYDGAKPGNTFSF